MVCHTQRYSAPLIEARRMIASGEVRPRAMVSRYLLDKRENVSWTGRRRSWTDNLLWHHGCHAVDAALWLLGTEAIDVTARATPPDRAARDPHGSFDPAADSARTSGDGSHVLSGHAADSGLRRHRR